MALPTRKRLTGYGKPGPTVPPDNTRSGSRLVPAVLCKAFEVYVELDTAKAAETMERLD
jgi:hypothetical protein